MPTPPRPRPRTAAVLTACVLVAIVVAAPAAATAPLVLPFDGEGGDVAVAPTAVRAAQGTAELDITLGLAAPGDVVVSPRLVTPTVSQDGVVGIGSEPAPGSVDRGSRLRPGERLRVTVTGVQAPTLVVADVTAPDGTGAATTPAALVLPGPLGAPPSVEVHIVGDRVEATVSTRTPLLVSVEVRGATATVHPDRLVLPDTPLVLTDAAPRWPLPATASVTDEAGRSVTASTGTTALVALAIALLATAVAGLVVVRRRTGSAGRLSA